MVCHNTHYILKHCTNNICSHSSKLQYITIHSRKQLPPIHSQTFSVLSQPPRLVPASPSPAVVCSVYLPACWLCVRMAIGMNDCWYREVLLRGILNLSLLSMRMLSVQIWEDESREPKLSSVCLSLIDDALCVFLSLINDELCVCFSLINDELCVCLSLINDELCVCLSLINDELCVCH